MTAVNPFLAGLRCRCPNCGEGALFKGYLSVTPRCEACGQDLSQADSGDGPVVFILLIVGAIGCGGLLFTELALHWPVWLELLVWLPLITLMTLGALRPFKAVLIALQFHNHASEARREDSR
ncbi:MAG: DUF983 domain-containing protein [Caulobacteraceae bacterium]